MEESEKRRERLKAMRMEAADIGVSNNQVAAGEPGNLSNPLLESMATPSVPASRFDFYTDPMSAFSSTRKRNNNDSQIHQGYLSSPINNGSPMGRMSPCHSAGPRNHNMSPTPNQYQMNYSPSPPPNQYQMNYSPSPPPNQYQMNYSPSPTPNQYQMNYSPNHSSSSAPMSCSWRTPTGVPNQFSGHRGTRLGVSGAWHQSGSSSGRGRGRFHNHDYGRGGSSPRSNLGRGGYHQNNSMPSPGSGRSNGRGRGRGRGGFHAHVSALEQPELFYKKFMIEDPWSFLKPVVRQTTKDDMKTPDSLNSWLPESLRMKKAKISEVTPGFSSHSSLAECLSLAFEEAVEDGTTI